MRKRIVLIIIFILVLVVAVVSGILLFNSKLDDGIQEKQNQIIKNIGVSSDNYYVYNKGNEYYVYNISGNLYIGYYYKIHKSEKSYNEYKDEYRGDVKANLFYDDESLFTRIKVDSGVVEDGFIESLDSKHKGFKKVN